MELNLYQNIFDVESQKKIEIYDLFELIKNPPQEIKDKILRARSFGENSDTYRVIKIHETLCVTYNFTFNGRKTNDNIDSPTGLMYIDIDDSSFDISFIDKSRVFAYYRSFGGNGYSILVKVLNLSLKNFNSSYRMICDELNISDFVDFGAKKATQYSIVSWDENIFINPSSEVFNLKKNQYTSSVYSNRVNYIIKKDKKKHIYDEVYQKEEYFKSLRTDNIDDIYLNINDEAIITNWDGFEYFSAWEPRVTGLSKKIKKNRNNILLSYCNNLVILNPSVSRQRIFDVLSTMNKAVFEIPVSDQQLNKVINSIYKYKEDGSLKPIMPQKRRKIIINPATNFSEKEKNELIRGVIARKKTIDTVNKIEKIITEWDKNVLGPISFQRFVDNFKMSKSTLSKYWKMFSEEIKLKK